MIDNKFKGNENFNDLNSEDDDIVRVCSIAKNLKFKSNFDCGFQGKNNKKSKTSLASIEVLNEKETIERLSHPYILNCYEIMGKDGLKQFYFVANFVRWSVERDLLFGVPVHEMQLYFFQASHEVFDIKIFHAKDKEPVQIVQKRVFSFFRYGSNSRIKFGGKQFQKKYWSGLDNEIYLPNHLRAWLS